MNRVSVSAFLGSPRKGGNTEILLNKALEGIKESAAKYTVFNLNEMDIRGCQDCGDCEDTGVCTKTDDMDEIYEAIRNTNRFILASPVFFFGLSAQAKAMVDRAQAFWYEKYLLKKPLPQKPITRKGLFISVGGMKKEIGYTCTQASAKAFFRTISVNEHQALSYVGFDEKGAILKKPKALEEVYEAGKKLVIV